MGSAFPADPYGSEETVVFLMWPRDDEVDLVCHLPHPECHIEHPHRMRECGRFKNVEVKNER